MKRHRIYPASRGYGFCDTYWRAKSKFCRQVSYFLSYMRKLHLDPGALLRMTKHWSWECTRYAIGLKWTTVFIQRSLRASSAIWTILASRLLSRASLESALHGIPQMESLLVGYIQRTLSLPRSLFCLVARVTRQQRLASATSAHSVQWKALNADRFLIV